MGITTESCFSLDLGLPGMEQVSVHLCHVPTTGNRRSGLRKWIQSSSLSQSSYTTHRSQTMLGGTKTERDVQLTCLLPPLDLTDNIIADVFVEISSRDFDKNVCNEVAHFESLVNLPLFSQSSIFLCLTGISEFDIKLRKVHSI